jgi:hypothetical protein
MIESIEYEKIIALDSNKDIIELPALALGKYGRWIRSLPLFSFKRTQYTQMIASG